MTVVVQVVVESRRYSGYTDRRYPIGYWQAAASATGDASGGSVGIDLVFQAADGPAFLNSQMYSVERISFRAGEDQSRTGRLSATNMGGPSNLGFLNQYALLVLNSGGITGANIRADQFAMLPLFLGSQRSPGTTAALSFNYPNIDLVSFNFEAEGYRWSPRSVLVDGGPQRPPTGLYRA